MNPYEKMLEAISQYNGLHDHEIDDMITIIEADVEMAFDEGYGSVILNIVDARYNSNGTWRTRNEFDNSLYAEIDANVTTSLEESKQLFTFTPEERESLLSVLEMIRL